MIVAHLGGGPGLWLVLAAMMGGVALAVTRRNPTSLLALAGAGIGFQVLHFAEHVLQAGYWVAWPREAPWLTPWAEAGRDGIAAVTDGSAGTGNELLHLVGNGIFLAGLVAAVVFTMRHTVAPRSAGARWLRTATWLQTAHVAEHVVLTATWLAMGSAHGMSTAFGLLEPGTALAGGVRVWFHFGLNLIATATAVKGGWALYQRQLSKGGIQWKQTRTTATATLKG